MGKTLTLGEPADIDQDIELCRTTNERICNQAAQLLMEQDIPFTRLWKKIPFFLRERYCGAAQIFIIKTNRNRYGQARRAIDQMDLAFRKRLKLSNY
jgi:hypothetical protein